MIIYKDILSGDELFSDSYPLEDDGILVTATGKLTKENLDIDGSLIGANASAEGGGDEGVDSSEVSGVDIVLANRLEKIEMGAKEYKAHIKTYMKKLKAKLEETKPDRVEPFMKGAPKAVQKILANFKDYDLYVGESLDVENGMLALLNYKEDGITPTLTFFKDGLEEEKC